MSHTHLWTPGATALRPGTALTVVDAGRRPRGPYTACGAVLRAIAPDLLRAHPDLVRRHDVELVAAAPELERHITPRRKRARQNPADLAHGMTELLLEYVSRLGHCPHTIVVDNAECAEPADAEWLTILLCRADPWLLRLVIRTGGPVDDPLATALSRYTTRIGSDTVSCAATTSR